MRNRAGFYQKQNSGYKSFVPSKLPPDPPIEYDNETLDLLSKATMMLGRLDGITQVLPNPDFFVAMYVKKEALLSSQIEGTQASLIDVIDIISNDSDLNVLDVIHYVRALNYGLNRLDSLPLSLRLIREIHSQLLEGGRGSSKSPGEFRTTQNWIGPIGCTLENATFIPPSVVDMQSALNELESYMHDDNPIPILVKIALIHAQFEIIHPFLDGNGRIGRLLITFLLCVNRILSKPLLYLSYYFKLNRLEYYDRLNAIREDGDWEGWLKFFLKGVLIVAEESTSSAKEIIKLRDDISSYLYSEYKESINCQKFLDLIFEYPVLTINTVKRELKISHQTASKLVNTFISCNILDDIDIDRIRNKRYMFKSYYLILEKGTELSKGY